MGPNNSPLSPRLPAPPVSPRLHGAAAVTVDPPGTARSGGSDSTVSQLRMLRDRLRLVMFTTFVGLCFGAGSLFLYVEHWHLQGDAHSHLARSNLEAKLGLPGSVTTKRGATNGHDR